MYAVVISGGKQYRVSAGARIVVDEVSGAVGDEHAFDQVLMVGGDKVVVGTPTVPGAKVTYEVIAHEKGAKTEYTRYLHRRRTRTQKNGRARLSVLQVKGIEV